MDYVHSFFANYKQIMQAIVLRDVLCFLTIKKWQNC